MRPGSIPDHAPAHPSAADWDRQFATGGWEYLKGLDELAHHSVIAGYIAHGAGPSPAVLDVGCGEAVLQGLLRDYTYYLGIDWSSIAIDKVSSRRDARTHFAVAEAEGYEPLRRFDAIVFSECLYYFKAPAETLARYARSLNPDGLLVVSMYREPYTANVWRAIEDRVQLLDRVRVTNAKDTSWDVGVLRPRR